jgi:hypothetical protein
MPIKKIAMELTVVRENLMTREGYSPYCGNNHCTEAMPRTMFDKDIGQFTCKCGWISAFPKQFIRRYMQRWAVAENSKKTSNE